MQDMHLMEEEERCHLDVPDDEIDETNGSLENEFYCKLMINKSTNAEFFRSLVLKIWGLKGEMEIESMERNVFMCYFQCPEDKKFEVEGATWIFNRCLILFEESKAAIRVEDVEFRYAVFWVQIRKLPRLCLT